MVQGSEHLEKPVTSVRITFDHNKIIVAIELLFPNWKF